MHIYGVHASVAFRGITLSKILFLAGVLVIASLVVVAAKAPAPIDIGVKFVHGFHDGGDLWLATERDGIYVVDVDSGSIQHLVEDMGAPVNKTTCGISAFGRIWLGSQGDLFVSDIAHTSWEAVARENLPSSNVNCIALQGEYLWVGTSKGVARYDSGHQTWMKYTKDDGLSDSWVLSIHAEEELVWFGTMRGGVCQFDQSKETWRSWTKDDGLVTNTVFTICSSPDQVFAGTTNGLSILDLGAGVWSNYGTDYLPSSVVYSLLWDPDLEIAWIGTGYGISTYRPDNGTFEITTKVGEINLEKVNDLIDLDGVVWLMRATNRWYAHLTTGILGFDRSTLSWIRPIHLDVLIDQSGYGPGDRKGLFVQSNEPIEGESRFSVLNLAGEEVHSGELEPRFSRSDWDAYYWKGDFTGLQRRGNFTISVKIGEHTGSSPRFEMDNEVLIDECGELIYEFLRYMRCGVAHEYRPKACHLDDGILPNGTHIDATGGWHCAGIWGGKWTSYQTYVIFNLLLARDLRPDFFDPIDRDSDGLPDILNEAMWGCDYLLRLQMENGSIHQDVEKVEHTDGIIGTPDDRKITGWMSTYNGLLAVAGLAGTSALVRDLYPAEVSKYMEGAHLSFDFYGSLVSQGPSHSIEGAAMTLACTQLYRATGNETYMDLAEQYCKQTLDLPFASYRGSFVPVALGYYLELNPATVWKQEIIDYIVNQADQQLVQWTSPDNLHLPFEIPTWYLYLMDPWAAEVLYAYRLTGNQSYLDHAITLIDCHLGVNPYNICYIEGTGTFSPPAYTSSFACPSNPRGAVPGSIPQGIQFRWERPYYDMSPNPEYSSGETWLINTNFIQTISLLPRDENEYPLEISECCHLLFLGMILGASLIVVRRRPRS